MRIEVLPDAAAVGAAAAAVVVAALISRPHLVLGVATGSSPGPLYDALAQRVREGLDTSGVQAWALDEYVGLPASHPESYHAVVARTVTGPLGLDPASVHVPDGAARDPHASAADYEAALARTGGVDLQILGIGHNGHLAFNEPGSPAGSRTRVVPLTVRTRQANARFFGGDVDAVPTHAITQGLGTIGAAGHLLLVATGADKAEAVAAALTGEQSAEVPASLVQRHPQVTVLLDAAAARHLPASFGVGAARLAGVAEPR
ncbi:glucosamine-6-phosphate deaminase [Cellulomonas soli]|uniref:glucosamine-6-phosphate deaminase n=1 Tax=Cellulomonas soli TaxID=931535 RepID=UPI003F840F81